MGSSEYRLYTLDNGLRVAHYKTPSTNILHCGYVIHAGSRNDGEMPGLAHFLEHMFFKGTKKRKTIHVLNHLEVVGGELNAFTTKEITAIYATVQKKHLGRAIDILTDITFNSTFIENEIQKEKIVIKDEINMYLDSPEENIYDEFQELVFNNHPVAHNILGNSNSVESISKSNLLSFVDKYYHPENMVFVVVGNISIERVVNHLNKHSNNLTFNDFQKTNNSSLFKYEHPQRVEKRLDFGQSYAIMGIPTYSETNQKRYPLFLLNNLLGGPGMNSRLNIAIREKYGYTYHIESGFQTFEDTGLFHCYLSCEEKYLKKSIELIEKQLHKLKNDALGRIQLSQAKNQLIGQLVLANEARSGLILHIGKGILKHGKANSIEETIRNIQSISALDLMDVANEVLKLDQFSHLYYLPEK